jgi:hypothetical protein
MNWVSGLIAIFLMFLSSLSGGVFNQIKTPVATTTESVVVSTTSNITTLPEQLPQQTNSTSTANIATQTTPIQNDGTQSAYFSVSPVPDAAPFSVYFCASQGSGDVTNFGDGSPATAMTPISATSPDYQSCGPGIDVSHTYKRPGTYVVTLYDSKGDQLGIATTTLTASSSTSQTSSVSFPGMSEYTDSEFGFSFWYPSGWIVTQLPVTNDSDSNGPDSNEILVKTLEISGPAQQNVYIDEAHYPPGPWIAFDGECTSKYFFDTNKKRWAVTLSGCDEPTSTSYDLPQYGDSTNPYTMGGLPELFSQEGLSGITFTVPLSGTNVTNAVDISADDPGEIIPLMNTIVATNPSIATPVSATEQSHIIRTEAFSYGVVGTPVGEYWYKDSEHVYDTDGNILPGVNPANFVLIGGDYSSYATDGVHVYSGDTVIPGADLSTFVVSADGFDATDKNHTYSLGKIVQ